MATINPYLTFNGNCEEAFAFYKDVFGRDFAFVGRFKDMPAEYSVPESEQEKIMHIALPISNETVLMGSDSSDAFGKASTFGNNISISINGESEEETNSLFKKLSEGGQVHMALDKTFWGSLFGMFTDKFGINWMVNYELEQKNN